MKTEFFEDARKLVGYFGVERVGKLLPGHLDADQLTMKAYTELPEPKSFDRFLARLDGFDGLGGYPCAVGNPGAQTSRGRPVPCTKSSHARQLANLRLGQPGVHKRGLYFVFLR